MISYVISLRCTRTCLMTCGLACLALNSHQLVHAFYILLIRMLFFAIFVDVIWGPLHNSFHLFEWISLSHWYSNWPLLIRPTFNSLFLVMACLFIHHFLLGLWFLFRRSVALCAGKFNFWRLWFYFSCCIELWGTMSSNGRFFLKHINSVSWRYWYGKLQDLKQF